MLKLNGLTDTKEVTLKLTLLLGKELVAFIGLIQLLFSFFFVIDMLMTWYHPIKYVSHQKTMMPIFMTSSKACQVFLVIFINRWPNSVKIIWTSLVILQAWVLLFFLISQYCLKKRQGMSSKLIKLILRRYVIPFTCCVAFNWAVILYLKQKLFPDLYDPFKFKYQNALSPLITLILVVIKLYEPQSIVFAR